MDCSTGRSPGFCALYDAIHVARSFAHHRADVGAIREQSSFLDEEYAQPCMTGRRCFAAASIMRRSCSTAKPWLNTSSAPHLLARRNGEGIVQLIGTAHGERLQMLRRWLPLQAGARASMSGVPNARTPCFRCIDSADRGSLAIERQVDALGVDEVRTRLKKVRSRASSAASVADSAIFAKVKSWLERKNLTEPA